MLKSQLTIDSMSAAKRAGQRAAVGEGHFRTSSPYVYGARNLLAQDVEGGYAGR